MATERNYYRKDEKEELKKVNIYTRKRYGRFRSKSSIGTFIIFFIGVIVFFVWKSNWAGEAHQMNKSRLISMKSDETDVTQKTEETYGGISEESEIESTAESTAESETEIKDDIPRDEWYMVLVNKENPLPEDFTVELATVDGSGNQVDARIVDSLEKMIEEGSRSGLQLVITSAYRSKEYQQILWDRRLNKYIKEGIEVEEAVSKTSALVMPPNCSDHNAGLAVDITTTGSYQLEESFAETPEAIWLAENSWRYGFILRYPKGKEDITKVKFEPWHFRYVGKEQAKKIYNSGLCLEEYLDS